VAKHWQMSLRYAQSRIEDANAGVTTRRSGSALATFNDSVTSFSPKLEYRRDRGAQSRDQYLLSVGLTRKFSENWRTAMRLRTSLTKDRLDRNDDARFTEASLGLAYRPVDNNRWAWLSKYTYLYDLGSIAQVSPTLGVANNAVDQRAHIVATEALYRINALWEVGGKYAYRTGELREGRNTGDWYKNTRQFAAVQLRLQLIDSWDVLVEHRQLRTVEDKNRRSGWLAGVDKQITPHFRLGVGYNFTDFSDDLRQTDYRFKGWYLNAVGVY
jgi:opacity protein-like surface antigen